LEKLRQKPKYNNLIKTCKTFLDDSFAFPMPMTRHKKTELQKCQTGVEYSKE
jgi:hypothetical protein